MLGGCLGCQGSCQAAAAACHSGGASDFVRASWLLVCRGGCYRCHSGGAVAFSSKQGCGRHGVWRSRAAMGCAVLQPHSACTKRHHPSAAIKHTRGGAFPMRRRQLTVATRLPIAPPPPGRTSCAAGRCPPPWLVSTQAHTLVRSPLNCSICRLQAHHAGRGHGDGRGAGAKVRER